MKEITYKELRESIESDVTLFADTETPPYGEQTEHLKKRVEDFLDFKLKWLYAKEKPSTKDEIDKLKQIFHDDYLKMLEEYCLSLIEIYEKEQHITINQENKFKLVKEVLAYDTGANNLISIFTIYSLTLYITKGLVKEYKNKLNEKRTIFDQELTDILNTFTARSYYQNIETDLNTYKSQTLNNIMDSVQKLGDANLGIYQVKEKINYYDLIKKYKSYIRKMFLTIEDILDSKLFLKTKIAILYKNKIINAPVRDKLNIKVDNIRDFASYQEFENTLVKIASPMYNMYKKKIIAKVLADDIIFAGENVKEYFKIIDEYATDDIAKIYIIMIYFIKIDLDQSALMILATMETFDIIKSQNHKF